VVDLSYHAFKAVCLVRLILGRVSDAKSAISKQAPMRVTKVVGMIIPQSVLLKIFHKFVLAG